MKKNDVQKLINSAKEVQVIRNSYLDVGSRKKEYLAIYQDIVKRNYILTQQLIGWNSMRKIKQIEESAKKPRTLTSKEVLANNARQRVCMLMAREGG